MSGFIQGEDRSQATLFPERLDDYVAEDNSVRVIDVFLDDLDLSGLGFTLNKSTHLTVLQADRSRSGASETLLVTYRLRCQHAHPDCHRSGPGGGTLAH